MNDVVATAMRPLRAAAASDRGRVRSNNEDLALLDPERGIYGVIDGVGGHVGGEQAAAIARDVILQRLGRPLGTPAERVREAIALANNEIFRQASTTPGLAGMTCVVTLALVADGRLTIGHVGDSRLYKLGPHGLRKLTHDHSPVGEREDAQELDELAAMRHPRRNEVFRDVGSALRDKDEADYVELVEDTLADDEAVLVCSDGLTDMVTSAVIADTVRAHAGAPERVVAALVAAANEAGGRDNVTTVYAEGPAFAGMARQGGRAAGASAGPRATLASAPWGVRHRAAWFIGGLITGAVCALLGAVKVMQPPPVGGRVLPTAPIASETFVTLSEALAVAQPGDVIRLEPGQYAERAVLPAGVSLEARVPGASTFVRPPAVDGDWVAILATGDGGGRVSGVRVSSTADLPVQIGVRVTGHGRALELLQLDGPMGTGVDVAADASATLRGSRFDVDGAAVQAAERSQLEAVANVFVRPADTLERPALAVSADTRLALHRNVFAGFGAAPVAGLGPDAWEPMRAANVVLSADPTARR